MSKSRIEWTDYTINPVKGLCPMACTYCYARRMYKRFGWNPEIRFEPIVKLPTKPSKIFVGSTMELFGEWIDAFWLDSIFKSVKDNPQHTFLFLTKQPQNLIKWSPFPDNCWVGVSPITNGQLLLAITSLEKINAKVKFLSLEPLRNRLDALPFALNDKVVNWLIIGQQTPVKKATKPKIEWINEIVEAAGKANIPVFLKDNLRDVFVQEAIKQNPMPNYCYPKWARNKDTSYLRQEFPVSI